MKTPQDLVASYLAIWNETDDRARRMLISEAWTEDATYVDPMFEATGHDQLDGLIAGFQSQFPGLTFRQVRDTESHHDLIRFSWELAPDGGEIIAAGTDVATISDGRLQTVAGFFDQAPVL